MLGVAVLPCMGTHPLGILRWVVNGAWGSHEGRRWPHGVEHVWTETCGNKVGSFRQTEQATHVLLLGSATRKQLAYSCALETCISPVTTPIPKLLPLYPVQLGAILTQHTSFLTDKSWWEEWTDICNVNQMLSAEAQSKANTSTRA